MFPSKFLQFPSILTHFHAANEKIQNGGRDLAISRGLVWVKDNHRPRKFEDSLTEISPNIQNTLLLRQTEEQHSGLRMDCSELNAQLYNYHITETQYVLAVTITKIDFVIFVCSPSAVQQYNHLHYGDVIMSLMASQITSLTIVYSTVYSGADQRKDQSSASLAFVRGIHLWPMNSPQKWPVTQKMYPFDKVTICSATKCSG